MSQEHNERRPRRCEVHAYLSDIARITGQRPAFAPVDPFIPIQRGIVLWLGRLARELELVVEEGEPGIHVGVVVEKARGNAWGL